MANLRRSIAISFLHSATPPTHRIRSVPIGCRRRRVTSPLSAVTYLTLGALLGQTHASRRFRIYFMSVGVLLALMVGLSRIYLGVHYPTDVLAGWCIGSAWAWACWILMTRLQQEGQVEPPEQP